MRYKPLQFTLGFIFIGLVIATLIVFVQRKSINAYDKNLPYVRLSDQIKSQVDQANLWVGQVKTEDLILNFDRDVFQPLTKTRTLLEDVYNGKATEVGEFEKINDIETKALLKEVTYNIQNLAESCRSRWSTKTRNAPSSGDSTIAVDVEAADVLNMQLDNSFRGFRLSADKLINVIDERVLSDFSNVRVLSWVSIIMLSISFAAVAFIYYRFQYKTHKLKAEKDLSEEQQERATQSLATFMEAISAGNYLTELDNVNHGSIGKTLIAMRDKLRSDAEEDRKRNWATSGLAQIGELLRASFTNTQDLFDNIITFVVKYTKSNQGGLFLYEENESKKYLELVACYAFSRKKYLTKTIEIGEGLVGQCFMEAESINLADVPNDYITIASSLGGANPNALLLVPLKVNGKVFGILELATFGKYESHELELVEKFAESIASTISTVRINESTRILLEKTQQQTEEMRAQEEEMRQNMEELEATQEEMRRKEKHIQNLLDSEKKRNDISNKNRQTAIELSKKTDIKEGNWDGALEKMTMAIVRQLTIARCGVRSYDSVEKKLKSEKLYDNVLKKFESESDWLGKDYPAYFEALTREEPIVAKDAHTHVATRELALSYFVPRGMQSMLVVPFFNEGKIAGTVCCEHAEQKEWTEEDVEFIKACSDLVTLTYSNRKINTMLDRLSDDQETMQTVIDNIPRAVFWKGKDLRFQGCNKIFAQVAGLKSYLDLIGRTDYDMPWKEHGDAYRADDLAVMNSRKARLDLEEENVNNDGKVSWVLTSKVPVMNKHGETVAVLGMFEDITERKHKEADIAAKMHELEELKKLIEKRNN